MPSIPANANKFLLNTDYPIDKVSGTLTGSFTVASAASAFPEINHGLGYAPLYFLKWSLTPNFDTSYDEMGVTFNFVQNSAQVDATKLYMFALNLTGATVTIYYRVVFFAPTDIDPDIAGTQASLDKFALNTDYNYTKIFSEGVTAGGSATIEHGLGYYPQVELWYSRQSDGRMVHIVANDATYTDVPRAIITPTQLILQNGSLISAGRWHYKIYADAT